MKVKDIPTTLRAISVEVYEEYKIVSIDIDSIVPGFVVIVLKRGDKLRGSYEGIATEVIKRALKTAILHYQIQRRSQGGKGVIKPYLFRKYFEKYTVLLSSIRIQFDLVYPIYLNKLIEVYWEPKDVQTITGGK